jgi:hypothetical protein
MSCQILDLVKFCDILVDPTEERESKMEEDLSVDKLSAVYLKIRTAREELKAKFDADDKVLADQMTDIENALIDALNSAGADSIATPHATVIRRITTRYNPTNWDAIYKLVHKHKAYGLLFKRVHDANMKEFLEQNPDEFPEGLNVDRKYAVTVRRKSST